MQEQNAKLRTTSSPVSPTNWQSYPVKLGIGTEDISAERRLACWSALLGILKAGAAYLPLDPAFPRHRMERAFQLKTHDSLSANFAAQAVPLLAHAQLPNSFSERSHLGSWVAPVPPGDMYRLQGQKDRLGDVNCHQYRCICVAVNRPRCWGLTR